MNGNLLIPLSPPSSPRMSGYSAISNHTDRPESQSKLAQLTPDYSDDNMALMHSDARSLLPDPQKRPIIHSHKTFPYTLGTASCGPHQASTPETSSGASPVPGIKTLHHSEDISRVELPMVNYGGSAPTSPVNRLTPKSPNAEKGERYHDLNGLDLDDGDGDMDQDDDDDDLKQPLTAAELRAQKRKMKRFRLTHNQTRFLMSEFARQAHPDAAHRERLSREIPGLSPRQVQVWFQNRRAKLKRLTSDDRERMMRSRALPEDFDMTRALHSPFGVAPNNGGPLPSPAPYTPAFPEGSMVRPLNLDALRRPPEGTHMSPSSVPPSYGYSAFTPPQSATEVMSPVSGVSEGAPFNFSPSIDGSPRRSNPFSGPVGPSTGGYAGHAPVPRLHTHDHVGRSRADSVPSPLRTSMSYSNQSAESGGHANDGQGVNSAPLEQQPWQRNSSSPMLPYGLGYNYQQIPGFQASAANRIRSFSGGVPRRIELSNSFAPNRSGGTPQTANFPNFQHSPLGPSSGYNVTQLSAPHHITSFQNSYLRQEADHHNEQFPSSIGGAGAGGVVGSGEGEHHNQPGDHNDGGVHHHLPTGYQ